MPSPDWICASFAELDRRLLYAMLHARAEVFVVEQECIYQDLDGRDQTASHLCGLYDGELACYARINAPDSKTGRAAVSRVLVKARHRARGLGRLLMREALARCEQRWPDAAVGLSAQRQLTEFYRSLGFRPVSEPYDDAGIPHVDMLLQAPRRIAECRAALPAASRNR